MEALAQGLALAENGAHRGIRLPLAAVDEDLEGGFQKDDACVGRICQQINELTTILHFKFNQEYTFLKFNQDIKFQTQARHYISNSVYLQ